MTHFNRRITLCLLAAGLALLAGSGENAQAYPQRTGNYLIVVPVGFQSSAAVAQLASAKASQGLTVSTYVVPSGTTNTAIKNYIVSLYGTANEPDYILLIGDTSGSTSSTTTIPHFTGTGSKAAPTDWPYGCMPGGISWYPDIPVGRFSGTNETHLQTMVNKTLLVESGNYSDPTYVTRGAFLANSDTAGLGDSTHDWVISNYFDPLGYTGIKIYQSQGGGTAQVSAAVNQGCLFTVYMGHSSSSGWWGPAFYQDNVNALTNAGLYGLVFGWSCNTSAYTTGECFGETWVRAANKGAAAYISASTYIYWGSYNDWIMSSIHEKSFFGAFFQKNIWEVGPAWIEGLYKFLSDYGGWNGNMNVQPPLNTDVCHNFFEEFVILGDPSLYLYGAPTGMIVQPATGLTAEGQAGGPFTPNSIIYTLQNNSNSAIAYQATHSQSWVTVTNPGGTIPANGSASVQVYINANANSLGNGSYSDTVEFINLTTHEGDTTRTIRLNVGVPVKQYEWNMDTNPGWSTQGLWAWGHPTGGGGEYGGPDPSNGYTGANVYGYNLNGDYENSLPERHLTTTAIDCSNLGSVSLKFRRWLGVEQPAYDHATLSVSNNGVNWYQLWTNPAEITESSWSLQQYDISQHADGQPTVYIRWTMGTTDSAWRYCGWNIDDVEIWGLAASEPVIGDVDGDGDVDIADLAALLSTYGLCDGDPGYLPSADFAGDDDCITIADLAALLSNYGFSG